MGDSYLDSMELETGIDGSTLSGGRNFRPLSGGSAGAARASITASPLENQSHPNQQMFPAGEVHQMLQDAVGHILLELKKMQQENKQQGMKMPDRMNKDFCNKTAESGVALTKTFNYLNTRGLGRLVGADLLFLYQLAYIKGQYLNEKTPVLDSSSKSIRARAQNNLWEVVHKKAEKSTNNVEEMKLKIKNSMKNGFMPL